MFDIVWHCFTYIFYFNSLCGTIINVKENAIVIDPVESQNIMRMLNSWIKKQIFKNMILFVLDVFGEYA